MKRLLAISLALLLALSVCACAQSEGPPSNTPTNVPTISPTTDTPTEPTQAPTDPSIPPIEPPADDPKESMDVPRFTLIKHTRYYEGQLGQTQTDTFTIADNQLKQTVLIGDQLYQEISYDLNTYKKTFSTLYTTYGHTAHYKYDEYGNVLGMTEYKDGELVDLTTYEYTYFDERLVQVLGYRLNELVHNYRYIYDNQGRKSSEIMYSNDAYGEYSRTEYEYDDAGRLSMEIRYVRGLLRNKTHYIYDEEGRLIERGDYTNTRKVDYNADGTIKTVSYYQDNTLLETGTFEYDHDKHTLEIEVRDTSNRIIARYFTQMEIVNLPYEQAQAALKLYETLFPNY